MAANRSRRSAEAIRRYRRSEARRRLDGVCRFDPSCSAYALEAFETRAWPVAMAMTASRLLRCNPLTRRLTKDPVRRARRGPRPGAVRSLALLAALSGFVMLVALGGTASADPPTGGCTGSANGRDAAGITRDDPLVVKEHQTVSASGNTPPGKSGPNLTHVKVILIDGIGGITTSDHAGDGDTWSSSSIKVDDYLKYGVGTYKVEVTNTGSGWTCTYVGYVRLDGNPLSKPIGIAAAGLAAVGAVGALAAPRRRLASGWVDDQTQTAAQENASASPMDTVLKEGDKVLAAADQPQAPPPHFAPGVRCEICQANRYFGCPWGCVVAMLLAPLWAMPLFGAGGGGGVHVARQPSGPVLWKKRVWRRGHPVVGFVSGLIGGIGGTVLLWQYNVWLLNTFTAIVVPLGVGVLVGVYAWIGRRFDIVGYAPSTPSESPAAAAPAMPSGEPAAPAGEAAPPPAADD